SNTCKNGGTCEAASLIGKPTCKCAPGFTGEECQYSESHLCYVSQPCLNGGTCHPHGPDTYECVCLPGFTGKECQWIDACTSQPCANGSTCTVSGNKFSCTCLAGYTGQRCETDVNECATTPGLCQHGGTCVNLPGSHRCQCRPGYTGPRCESLYVPCSPSPCLNGGTCHQTSDFTFECNCLPGFEGTVCGHNVDDCPNHKCLNGGVCVDGVNTYNCRCPPQWTGQFCTEDVDECQLQPNACQNGGTCTNHNGGYACVCVNGWSGDDCSKNIDDCFTASCANGSTCIDRVASFSCICPEGKAGLLCHLDDACVSNPCQKGALCDTNPVNGNYICTCPQGHKGADCTEDVDECAMGDNPCEHAGKCVNTEGSFHCECLKGYTGPRCEMDINECHSNPCQNDATCLDKIGGFTCLCMPGFKGVHCEEDIDECLSNPCVNNGVCLDKVNRFLCVCPPGFSGAVCQIDIDDCSSTPCLNGAKCIDHPNGYECQCATGFTGTLCEENINNCDPDPCHHGECQDGIDSYTCICNPGYMGGICSEQIDECHSNPCLNQGRCIDLVNGYQCNCLLGTSGINCENNFDDCASNPCIHGTCIDGINRYNCACEPGFTGKVSYPGALNCLEDGYPNSQGSALCTLTARDSVGVSVNPSNLWILASYITASSTKQKNGLICAQALFSPAGPRCNVDIDECTSSPCHNGGTCVNEVNGFRCVCPEGFHHPHCQPQADGNECKSNPCQNGGTCEDLLNAYRCTCRKGFKGANCQLVVSPCSPNPCENSGICQESPDSEGYTCQCAPGWEGERCTVDIDECLSKPCKNHALCHNIQGSYLCECRPGFTGGDCDTNIDDCLVWWESGLQQSFLKCLSGSGKSGSCCRQQRLCSLIALGLGLPLLLLPCSSCFNGGTCVDGINSFTCQCPLGFTGPFCLTEINECDSQPCLNRGTCVDSLGTYRCICPLGYTGKNCKTLVDLCSKSPCKNKGTCVQTLAQTRCVCPPSWTGAYCDVPSVSCQVAASQRGVPVDQLCQHSGHCLNVGSSHHCQCQVGYTGSYCEVQLDECESSPCQNGATCRDHLGGYHCQCVPGYQGVNCEYEVDECQFQPCQNGGTCIDLVNHFKCSCPPGTRGRLCEENVDDCISDSGAPRCFNGGQCIDQIGGFSCLCPQGFAGERCEGDINECLSNPCNPRGSLDCVQLTNDYRCICRSAFTGRHCESVIDVCPRKPCQNGGTCAVASNMPEGFICQCPPGYSGAKCEFNSHSTCGQVKCKKGEQCIQTSSGPRCYCPKLSVGEECQTHPGCASAPCQNGGSCHPHSQPPYYYCQCPAHTQGSHCEQPVTFSPEPRRCLDSQCAEKARDGYCDEDCNTHACQWDGGDCSLTVEDPWANCSSSLPCWMLFNGQCDEFCNTPECLFDNFECQQNTPIRCPCCRYDKYCADHYADGRCDQGCNSEECGWDGLDCAGDKAEKLAEGTLIIVVLMPPDELLEDVRSFLRTLGTLLHTNLRIKLDSKGNPMVFPYYGEKSAARSRRSLVVVRKHRELEQEVIGTKVFLEIDNRQCAEDSEQCFHNTEAAAALLAAQAIKGMLPYPFVSVQSEPLLPPKTQLLYLLAVAALIILLILLLGVMMAKRKRKHGSLWLPEGFILRRDPSNHKRREPVGEDSFGCLWPLGGCFEAAACVCAQAEDQALLPEGDEQIDQRQWTQQHLEAADVCGSTSLALTPPQADQEVDVLDVNVRGPDGCTPLMLASLRAGGSDISEDDEDGEDSSANIITDLIYQGANLQAQTDRTGEMALHLAARYSRADAAKRLLDAGADANARDNMGRTPLHAAVAADAQGVFQILIRNRVTDLDARMNDGTTPLILAARLAVEGMVAELINCQADVNAVDDHGKSALHWAAAVNNVEATLVLLKNGANRDMQDNKEETPLFLAAREGSFEAAKILLDHFANRDITDHMDRLPRDVAQDRMHHDIVQLLNEYNVAHSPAGHPGAMLNSALSPVICGPNRSFLNLKHASLSKKSRKPNAKGMPTSLTKDAKRRRKKSLSEGKGQFSESSVTLSPVDSLESPHAFASEPTSSPVMPSPGVLHSSPSSLLTAPSVQAAHTMSFSNLHEMQPLGRGSGTVLPSVSQLLSQHRTTPPNSGLGRLRPGNVSSEWMNRMEVNESQYNEMFGMVPQVMHSHPSVPQQSGLVQADAKHLGVSRESLPPIMTFQLVPKGSINQQALPQQAQSNCAQNMAGPLSSMYQIPDLAQLPSASFSMAAIPQQDGQVAQTVLPAYHQFQSSMGKYPTPPSQHSCYSSATERTPSHNRHLQGEHPYLTPSPESPDQWSSSSPHSASDWSDVATSPSNNQRGPAAAHMPEQQRNNMQVYA
uniref:Neurogenic locus notch homolog protein 2 n=1 Tax=Junco hyemalis TaxID=40217 RepID=A0A8C5ILB4_JUNHY